MNWILKTILTVWIYQRIFLEQFMVYGDGIDIAECKIDCACCKDQVCGQGSYFTDTCFRGCIDGHFGARCYQKCTYNCTKCYPVVDTCTSCYDGYHPGANKDCTEKCPIGCKSCESSKICTECMEGFYNANGSTDCRFRLCPLHCHCEQGMCVSCEPGYYNTSSECTKTCPPNCVTCSSNDMCKECKDGYYNGYEFNNNHRPQFNDCRHECREHCSSCSSYNDCLECEVGSYGLSCEHECSIGCHNTICMKETGNCKCKTNFSGVTCTECKLGKFGSLCNEKCSLYCKHNLCDKLTGYCLDGCIQATITGDICNACLDGKFGEFCNKTCPINCKNKKCNRNSGTCSDGCKMHFVGIGCQNCDEGRYGVNCEYICPERCSRGVCIKESGNCQGCNGNFIGDKCENCQTGYYGPYCNDKCSKNCFIDICDRNSGLCIHGCKSNYFGDKCCLQNSNCMKCSSNTECNECKSGSYGETCNKTCSSNCVDQLCKKETGVCVFGCHDKYDRICVGDVENQKPEDKPQTVIIVMGVIIALLALVVISVIAVVVWKRQSTQRNSEDAIVTFENAISSTNAEQRGDNEDMSTRKDPIYYNTKEDNHESLSAGISTQSEYEKVNNVEVSEHEYEHISSAV